MSSDDDWPFNVNTHSGDVPMLRSAAIKQAALFGHTITEFTCDNCPDKLKCDLLFDSYNTDGDCLAIK